MQTTTNHTNHTMADLHAARKEAADEALADHDFEPEMVTDTGSWDTEGDRHDEWTCVLSMDDEESQPYACGFLVRFKPGSATVREAYPGDRH
jgi:hypothetical protein